MILVGKFCDSSISVVYSMAKPSHIIYDSTRLITRPSVA